MPRRLRSLRSGAPALATRGKQVRDGQHTVQIWFAMVRLNRRKVRRYASVGTRKVRRYAPLEPPQSVTLYMVRRLPGRRGMRRRIPRRPAAKWRGWLARLTAFGRPPESDGQSHGDQSRHATRESGALWRGPTAPRNRPGRDRPRLLTGATRARGTPRVPALGQVCAVGCQFGPRSGHRCSTLRSPSAPRARAPRFTQTRSWPNPVPNCATLWPNAGQAPRSLLP